MPMPAGQELWRDAAVKVPPALSASIYAAVSPEGGCDHRNDDQTAYKVSHSSIAVAVRPPRPDWISQWSEGTAPCSASETWSAAPESRWVAMCER